MVPINDTPEQVIRAWNDAYVSKNVDLAVDFFAEDFFRVGDTTRWVPVGKPRWGDGMKAFFRAFPDWSWRLDNLYASGDTVICEFLEFGTWTEPYVMTPGITLPAGVPELVMAPTGQSYSDHNADFFRVRDGKIVEIRAYVTNNLHRTFHFEDMIPALVEADKARAAVLTP